MRERAAQVPDRLQRLTDRLDEEAPENCLGNGATVDEIHAVERELGVRLPESYCWFLREFGFTFWPEFIYGIAHGKSPGMRVTWQAAVERARVTPPLPRHLVPFSPDGWGNHYCLDTARWNGPECPVVFWDHEQSENQAPETTHGSFLEWLEDALEESGDEEEGAADEDAVEGEPEVGAPEPRPGRQLPPGPRGICYRPPHPGAPPLDRDGSPVELHLRNQNPAGPVDEILRLDHRGTAKYARNHPKSSRKLDAKGSANDS